MSEFGNPLVAAEVVCCIAEAREPTPEELARVAARIRREAALFDWNGPSLDPASDAYVRAASVALCGNADPLPIMRIEFRG
jgi:hypothetical protein